MKHNNKLNDTYALLDKLEKLIIYNNDKSQLKKHLLSVSDDLAKYKDMHEKYIISDKDEIKSKIQDVLRKIKEIEISVRNKLVLTEKYNSYLNS